MLTVRHLADRDPAASLPERAAGRLFDASRQRLAPAIILGLQA